MNADPQAWLRFLRHYGPIDRNDNMYDETILRSARRSGVRPIQFAHPIEDDVLRCMAGDSGKGHSVILTGTAGDGKTHLCRQAWRVLGGNETEWDSDNPHLTCKAGPCKVHFIRDLSAWAPQHTTRWNPARGALLTRMCEGFFDGNKNERFLIAANDGQLVDALDRLDTTPAVEKARRLVEDLLVEDRQERSGVYLRMFNLSRTSSSALFDLSLDAFLEHPGWQDLRNSIQGENDPFGEKSPIRWNYELLGSPLLRSRLRALLELCDRNGLHVPIRQILILLANAVLGHPDVQGQLMLPSDVSKIITDGTAYKASIYSNIFGGNLSENRRSAITIFDYLERFQIGYETSNRVDNILIFGENDQHLGAYFDEFVASDKHYGADEMFYAAKRAYVEGGDEDSENAPAFLEMLVKQRQALFFKIPWDRAEEVRLWELTVFKYAGEYLEGVISVLRKGESVRRPILSRLVVGLNRVFTGMLVNSERELLLASSGNYSQARVSRILVERIAVDPSKGEKVVLRYDADTGKVLLTTYFAPDILEDFEMNLTRFEYLSRIALEGALPASFSKECYEDLLALKSRLIAAFMKRQSGETSQESQAIGLRILLLTDQGAPDQHFVEVLK